MIKRFKKVKDNLYRGGAPTVKDVIKLHKMLGINKIVSLDRDSSERIKNVCNLLKINHVSIPLDGSRKSLLNLLSHDLKELLDDNTSTFVHCHEGKDRTGFIVALFKCKYMGMNYDDAIKEAESLGFGIGVNPEFIDSFKKIIKSNSDINDLSIVDNQREYIQDERSSALDRADRGSFAPYLDKTRQYPYDAVYNYHNRQGDSRETLNDCVELTTKVNQIPLVGLYDNVSGIKGVGPVDIGTGFVDV